MSAITLVNFSHPITDLQREAIAAELGAPLEPIVEVATHFDQNRPFAEQTAALLSQVDVDWETTPLLVNLPAFSPIAAVMLAQLHGLMGHFPTIIRLRPAENTIVTTFELAEIISLDQIRNCARPEREV